MASAPLINITGQYVLLDDGAESVLFRWQWPAESKDCKDYICIAPVDRAGRLDRGRALKQPVSDCAEGKLSYPIVKISVSQVDAMRFGVFMNDREGFPSFVDRREGYVCSVIVGRSRVVCRIREPLFLGKGDLRTVQVHLSCSKPIAANILGYAFTAGGQEICIPFPALPFGKSERFEFLIPRNSRLQIKTVKPEYVDNVQIFDKRFL